MLCRIIHHHSSFRLTWKGFRTATPALDGSDVLPEKPIWSVKELLSSYPQTRLSPSTINHLHKLAALVPPEEGTPAREKLHRELEGLIRLVDSVKMVDVDAIQQSHNLDITHGLGTAVPDGRIWATGTGMDLSPNGQVEFNGDQSTSGRALLRHADKVMDGFYVVESERKPK